MLVGAGWIIAGYFLSSALYGQHDGSIFEMLNGLAFVAATATMLFIVLRHLGDTSAAKATSGEIAEQFRASVDSGERTLRRLPFQLTILVTALLCVLLLGLAWMRENALRAGEATAQAVQFTVAAQIGSSLRAVDITLADVARKLSAEKTTTSAANPSLHLQSLTTVARTLAVVDERGRMTYNSDGRTSANDFSGREYFRHHRDHLQSGFHISNPLRSVFTNTWFIAASHAVRGPAGEFRGVVIAVLDLERFGRYWQVPGFGENENITLFRNDGSLLLRSPHREEAPGRLDKRVLKWLELLPTHPAGVYRTRSAIDGLDKIFAYGRVQEYPEFVVVFGIPHRHLLRQWQSFAAMSLGAFVIFAGVVAVFTFILLRQLRARLASQRSAAELARYPLQNRNPIITVARNGTRLFMNDAARALIKSVHGSAAGQLDAAMQAMVAETAAGTREFTVGNRLWSASYTPQPAGHCDLYLIDITAARQDEELQRLFFDLPFIGMAITSPGTKHWLRFNDRLCEILGYSREELQQKTWGELTHPDDLAADVAAFERVMRGDSDGYALDKRFIRPDGTTVHGAIDVRAMRRPDRSIEFFVATVQDISERKQRENSLSHQRDLYAALSATNEAIIRLRERDALFIRVCQITVEQAGFAFAWIGLINRSDDTVRPVARYGEDRGYIDQLRISTDPELPGDRGITSMVVGENRHHIVNDIAGNATMQRWHEAAARAGVQSVATFPIRQGGTITGVLTLYARERDQFDTEVVNLLDEMAADLSYALDNIEGEQRLRESEAKFKGLVEQSLVGIFIVDATTVYYVNPRTAEILGYAPDEILGPKLRRLIHAEDWPRVESSISQILSSDVADLKQEFRGLRRDGATVHIGAHGSRAQYAGRTVVIGVLQDITDRLRSEQQITEYVARLERSIGTTVEAISQMVELRDPYTAGHERRVGELAAAIGAELGLAEHRITGLRIAGIVHDVGKIIVPAEILSKPGQLSKAEYELIKAHPEKGYDILKNIDFPWPVAQIVLQHHERMDGSGYPHGLKGEDICLEARILAVADVIEAMSSHRPYRPAIGADAGLAEITGKAGILYDAEVVAACLRLFRDKHYQLPA